MKLNEIGFYTLSDERALTSTHKTALQRCELLLTDRCNFTCPYCRGMKYKGDLPLRRAIDILELWFKDNLKNVRFSGGEPTMYPYLKTLISLCQANEVERIAVSTNGSNSIEYYKGLIRAGVNDISISLDACCASTGDKMAGTRGSWHKVVNNIGKLSKLVYVTVGIVIDENNIKECEDTIKLADNLGVSDIRIIPSAQFNMFPILNIKNELLNKYPILKYRFANGRRVRGIKRNDSHKCRLALDDMAVMGNKHYPCIIWLREGGKPISKIGANMREDRRKWVKNHNSFYNKICRENCLDVCVEYNNKAKDLRND